MKIKTILVTCNKNEMDATDHNIILVLKNLFVCLVIYVGINFKFTPQFAHNVLHAMVLKAIWGK